MIQITSDHARICSSGCHKEIPTVDLYQHGGNIVIVTQCEECEIEYTSIITSPKDRVLLLPRQPNLSRMPAMHGAGQDRVADQ